MATNVINIRRFVDVTTGVSATPTLVSRDWGAVLFVQKGNDDQATELKEYADLAEIVAAGSNTEAAKCAGKFYGTTYNNIAPTSPFFVATISAKDDADFTANFTALLTSEQYYLILLDSNFDASIRKAAASAVQGSLTTADHFLCVEDFSADAVNKSLEDDTTSVSAYCANNKISATAVVWVNPSNEVKYYAAGLASFYATRRFTDSDRRMASIAHKAASGLSPVDLTDGAVTVTPTKAFDNLDEKHANVYANIKIVGLPAWERGTTGNNDDISDIISAAYLNYTITINVFQTLQLYPRIAMNSDGASILYSAIISSFENLAAAGVIAAGVSLDGEVFSGNGYNVSIEIPTGVEKANGVWNNIQASALLAGSTKKVVINNVLKK